MKSSLLDKTLITIKRRILIENYTGGNNIDSCLNIIFALIVNFLSSISQDTTTIVVFVAFILLCLFYFCCVRHTREDVQTDEDDVEWNGAGYWRVSYKNRSVVVYAENGIEALNVGAEKIGVSTAKSMNRIGVKKIKFINEERSD